MLSYEYIHNPSLFNSTKLGRDMARTQSMGFSANLKGPLASMSLTNAGQTMSKNINPTQHWKSTYKGVVETTTSRDQIKSRRPLWSINRQAYSSSRGQYKTEFADTYGNHGHNPRDLLPHDSTKQVNRNFELSIGTAKVTNHIPGYNGFIPHVDIN